MTARNIPYTELNTTHDDEARNYLVKQGFKSVPVVVHGGTPYGSPDSIMNFIKQYK